MTVRNENPGLEISPQGLKNAVYKMLTRMYKSGGILGRTLIMVLGFVLVFCALRLGYLGIGLEQLSRRILPLNVPVLDPETVSAIPLSLSFDVVDDQRHQQRGRLGGSYRSGDQIILYIQGAPGHTFFYTLVGIDSKDMNVYRKNVKISPVDGASNALAFTLDDTLGHEAYYIIARTEEFEITGVLADELDAVQKKLVEASAGAKGGLAHDFSLSLNDTPYSYDLIHIKHIAKEE